MKKWIICLLALFVAVSTVALTVPQAQAAGHSHCVCGGSAAQVHDHQCEDIQWTPLSSVVDLSKVNWKDVPEGNYYLDGDVTVTEVTDGDAIGYSVKNADETYDTSPRNISLCLNGHKITTKKDRVFKGIYTGSTLNICDCSGTLVNGTWKWDGKIVGGTSATGGVAYIYANSVVNIYGGNITAKKDQVATKGGGLFYVAQDRAAIGDNGKKDAQYASTLNIYNGNLYNGQSAKSGGNIYVAHYSNLHVYGGYIHDGTATDKGGNISFGSKGALVLQNATIYNGIAGTTGGNIYPVQDDCYTSNSVYGGYPECVCVVSQEGISHEYSLQEALKKAVDGDYLKLMRDLTADTTIAGDVTLDMNGHDLTGVTVSGTLRGMDSATDSYTGDHAGQLTGTITGQILGAEPYLVINNEGYSFHRYQVAITHLSVKPAEVAMGYKAQFFGDDAIAEQVSEIGYELQLEGYPVHRYSNPNFTSGKVITLRLKNILSTQNTLEENLEYAEKPIYAKVFIRLEDGTKVSCDRVSYSFKDMVNMADNGYADYSAEQKAALQTLAETYAPVMMTWDVENFHHADEKTWEAVNEKQFKSKLIKNGSYRDVTPGTYVLTEDVDLSNITMQIQSGTTVTICLNGHTISGNQRMLRIYGTLNICDCHEHGNEGNMISSYANAVDDQGNVTKRYGAVFYTYYGSTFNLYGGNLKATGQLTFAGVGAISHEKQTDENLKNIPAGIMNMYGGTISGGNVTEKGGLLWVLHGASFNMYGGELFDGYSPKSSAIYINEDSYVSLYGGKIYDCGNNNIDLYCDHLTLGGDIQIEHINLSKNVRISMDQLTADAKVGISTQYYGYLTNNTVAKDAIILDAGQQVVEYNGKLLALEANVEEKSLQNTFSVGHSQICINPAVLEGIPLSGYGNSSERKSVGFESETYWLYANATAITDDQGDSVLLITYDLQRPQNAILDPIRQAISAATGLPVDKIILSASHSHSTPDLYSSNSLIQEYKLLLQNKLVQAAVEAMASRVPATMEASKIDEVRNAKGYLMNFSRHYYWYKFVGSGNGEYGYNRQDGTYYLGGSRNYSRVYYGDNFGTSPAKDSEKASMAHVTEGDHSMQLIRFVREGEKDVVLCNWAAHPTMTGGMDQYYLSSDYVGALRTAVQDQNNCYFSFVQGAAGNMNPTSRISGDSQYHKKDYAKYGQELARIVTQQLTQMDAVDTGKVQTTQTIYDATVMKHSQEEVERAKEFNKLPLADRKETYKDWGFTSIYHASSVAAKDNLNDQEQLELNTFSIGNQIAFYTVPGELWSTAAQTVKGDSPFKYTFTTGYANGDWKYFPDSEAADGTYENYEYYYCRFVLPDTTRKMIEIWEDALNSLYN